jgi:hypothetical protein
MKDRIMKRGGKVNPSTPLPDPSTALRTSCLRPELRPRAQGDPERRFLTPPSKAGLGAAWVNTGIIVSWGKSSGVESLFLTELDSQLKEKSSEKVKKRRTPLLLELSKAIIDLYKKNGGIYRDRK